MPEKLLIINADDFGFSENINDGIIKCFTDGILTSTTLAANMPYAEDAAKKAKDHQGLGIGIHLNVVRGKPLSPPGKISGIINSNCEFFLTHKKISALCLINDKSILEQIETEYIAQIEKALELEIKPTHIDSERHHAAWPALFKLTLKIAEKYNIPAIRTTNEPYWTNAPKRSLPNLIKSVGLRCLGMRNKVSVKNSGIKTTDYFYGGAHIGRISKDFLLRLSENLPAGISELMTHPGFSDRKTDSISQSYLDNTRQIELEALCDQEVADAFKKNNIKLINFSQIY